jgi:hypothetical protein
MVSLGQPTLSLLWGIDVLLLLRLEFRYNLSGLN